MLPTYNPFRDRVGLLGVDQTATLWVNDLSGLSTELAGDLAQQSDYALALDQPRTTANNARQVWESVHREALQRLRDELKAIAGADFDYRPTLGRTEVGGLIDPFINVPAAGGLTGLVVTVPPADGLTLRMTELLLVAQADMSTTVVVHDLDSRCELYRKPLSLSYGYNSYLIDLAVQSNPLFSRLVLITANTDLCALRTPTWLPLQPNAVLVDCQPVTLPQPVSTKADLQYVSPHVYAPFHLSAELEYNFDHLLRRHVADLTPAYRYLCGSLLLCEKRNTPNLTAYTMSTPKASETLEADLFSDFKKALKPVARVLVDELKAKQVVEVPTLLPNQVTYTSGSYV